MAIESRTGADARYRYGLVAVLLAFTALGGYLVVARPLLDLSDTLDIILRARRLLTPEGAWVDSLYPFGYPLLLEAVARVVTDYALAAKIISLTAGLVSLLFFYRTAHRIFDSAGLALLLTCFLAFDTAFFRVALLDGTDMAALAPLMAFFFYLTELPGTRLRPLFLAGLALGIGYLLRYSVLAALPGALLALALLAWHQPAARLRQAGVLLGGYLLGAGPQLLVSFYLRGNPFYNEQYRNIWFGMHGQGDWGSHWQEAGAVQSLWQVIAEEPGLFVDNMLMNLSKIFFMHMFDYPFLFLSWAGIVLMLALRFWRIRLGAAVLTMLALGGAISMAFVYWRIGIPALPGLILVSGVPFAWVGGLWARQKRLPAGLKSAGVTLIVLVCLGVTAERFLKNFGERIATPMPPADQARLEVRRVLQQNGYTSPNEVLSFSFDQYDTQDPTHPLYNRAWYYQGGRYGDTATLAAFIQRVQPRFLLTDNETHQVVPGFEAFWPNAGFERYADKLYSRAGVELWKLRPTTPPAAR